MSNLHEKLQIWGFENNFMIFRDSSIGACLKIEPIDVSCFNNESLNGLNHRLAAFAGRIKRQVNYLMPQPPQSPPQAVGIHIHPPNERWLDFVGQQGDFHKANIPGKRAIEQYSH